MGKVRVIDPQHIALTTSLSSQLKSRIPNAEITSEGVVLPWTYENALICAEVGAPACSTILRDYHWPAPFSPFSHQLKMSNFQTAHTHGFTLGEMGVGKTLSAIWSASYLREIGRVKKVLVVAPLSILEAAWAADIFKTYPGEVPIVLHGSAEKRRALAKSPNFWHLINFDGVAILHEELLRNQYDLIILDESRAYANPETTRWQSVEILVRHATYVWAMTGTPMPQHVLDVYGQVLLVNPERVPKNQYRFSDMVQIKSHSMKLVIKGKERFIPQFKLRDNALDIANSVMQPAIRVAKRDALPDLPPVTSTFVKVELTPAQRKFYADLRKDAKAGEGEASMSVMNQQSLRSKLIQCALGAVYRAEGGIISFEATSRLRELQAILEQCENGVLVFVPFKHIAAIVHEHLGSEFKVITGDVALSQRTQAISDLQSRKIRGIIATPDTMAHGITATEADTTIWYGPIEKNEIYMQANNRMDRPGQTRNMRIIHLYGTEGEREMYEALQVQGNSQAKLLSAYRSFIEGK